MPGRAAAHAFVLFTLLLSCSKFEPAPARALIRKTDATHVAIVPAAGQLPYCLVFTASSDAVVRLQTQTYDDLSIECEAGKPIGGQVWTIPSHNEPIRLFIVFSDRTIQATWMAQQISERLAENPKLSTMDLRAHGQVTMQMIDVDPAKLRAMP